MTTGSRQQDDPGVSSSRRSLVERIKRWAAHLKDETIALYYAYRDPRVPWYAKAVAAFVVAHTLSPIDLIPDFIPVLGFLDDLIITPLGLALSIRLIPPEVMQDARVKAAAQKQNGKLVSRAGLFIVIGIWLLLLILVIFIVYRLIRS